MKHKKTYRYLVNLLLILFILLISNIIVKKTNISSFSVFSSAGLFTYFGVLVGVSITIYTFGLTMIENIKKNINESKSLKEEKKEEIFNTLINGFKEIKEDIWIIFYAIIFIVIFAILKNVENPFKLNVENWKIPETVNLSLFIYSTICMYDIMKTLFNLSEINLIFIKKEKDEK